MAKFHLPTLEAEQQKKWDERKIFSQILARNAETERKPFVFFEGPPTANGKPGIHHLLGRAYKDVFMRFRTMQGYRIDRKAGWDTHGLPVELEVEKQLGFTKKQDIETYGIAAFNAKCRESVWTYLDLWVKSTKRLGYWVDLENPYITYKNEYVESVWWILKEVANKKIDGKELLYQGYRVTPHCPRCVTSLSSHELAQGYKDVKDPSVFVKFPVAGREATFYLVWTTTPWTLSGNVALAVGPEVVYVKAKMKESGETLILAKELLSVLEGKYEVTGEKTGTELAGYEYVPLYEVVPEKDAHRDNAYKVQVADFVSTGDGTGIVHIAPAFGEDDAQLGKKAMLPTLHTVDPTGKVTADTPGKGKFFKSADADVIEDLKSRGLLYKSETIMHPYPFCWRCESPILYYAKTSWYIRMSSLRDRLIANNAQVNWIPSHIKDGRFGDWLKEVKDWALSRERFWGTPLPVWQCPDCHRNRVFGMLDELDAASRPKNRFFLQRHGEAETNVEDVISSWPELREYHLTEKGREQIQLSAKDLKEKGIDMIFASDLLRTRETADIIAKELGLPVIYDQRLRELDVGDFNGKKVEDFHAIATRLDRFEEKVGGTGETLNDVRRRTVAFIKEMNAMHVGKNILLVSHGDVLWMAQTIFKGLDNAAVKAWPHYHSVGEVIEIEAPKNLPYDELGNVDVHRPFIDEVTVVCVCGGNMRRVPDVIDVWFDSGAMPFAQWGYPHNRKEYRRIKDGLNFPAEYVCEAIDQTRGWFYTLLAVSTLLDYDIPPYKNVICHGHVLDARGQKMSKSKGNAVDPFQAMDTYGADVLRWFFYSANQPGESKRFDPKAVEEVTKKVFLILWNVLTYWKMFAGEGAKAPSVAPEPKHELDRWILSELAQLRNDVTEKMESYDAFGSSRAIGSYIDGLSTWYVRRSRDRFKGGTEKEKAEAVATLGYVLRTLSSLMAPFTPHLAEAMYAEVGGEGDSIHLANWPVEMTDDVAIRASMEIVRKAASLGLEQRANAGIPVRQALGSAKVVSSTEFVAWMQDILKDEINVEQVKWEKGEGMNVVLDTVITPELRRKGATRELARNINDLRKQAGLTIQDRVIVTYATAGDFWPEVLKEHGTALLADVKADDFVAGEVAEGEGSAALEAEGQKMLVAVRKV